MFIHSQNLPIVLLKSYTHTVSYILVFASSSSSFFSFFFFLCKLKFWTEVFKMILWGFFFSIGRGGFTWRESLTVYNQFLHEQKCLKSSLHFRTRNVVSKLYSCMFCCAKKAKCSFKKNALNRKKKFVLSNVLCIIWEIIPKWETKIIHIILLLLWSFFSFPVLHKDALCDSLVCCYIMKCCICNKSSLLLCMCTGGNVTQLGAGLEVLVCSFFFLISIFYSFIVSFVSLYSIVFLLLLCNVCVPQVNLDG